MPVSRRQFLKASTGAAVSATLISRGLWPMPAMAATTLTGVTYITPGYKGLSWGSDGFVQQLKSHASGAVNVDFYPSGQLLKVDEQLPALRSRSIDFMFHTASYITRSLPILGITGLPGIVDELYHHPERLALGSPLFELLNEQLAKDDIYMLASGGGIIEPEYIWSTKRNPVRSLEDLRGKKVRVVSFEATKALEPYGIAAVRIPSSETYIALQRGTVDAAVANISTVVGRSLQEQLAVCYQLPVTAYTVSPYMLRSRWDRLDEEAKSALQSAAQWYDQHFVDHCNNEVFPNDYWPKVRQSGVEVIAPSQADLTAFNEGTHTVWDHWANEVGKDVGERAIALALGKSSGGAS